MSIAARMHMTEAAYLAYDASHDGKHEFFNGEVVAMSGASVAHDRVTVNLLGLLLAGLAKGPCRVHTANMRVQIERTGAYVYPDISVVCGAPIFASTQPPSLLNPTVVVEVLSPSTEAHDRSAKAAHYRNHGSLQAYVLVATSERRLELYVRQGDGSWRLTEAVGEGALEVGPLGLTIGLTSVYADVDLASA